ncbi:MAG: shikimate dehydrogenase [Paludibacter sp.]|nr:shikimate dehydrogenase [Paludibacter sp.]
MRFFGLIGYPLGHSFSKIYFTEKFDKENIPAQYDLYPLENISQFSNLILSVELTGLNVTIPYKEQIIPFLDELDETAAEIGAVNVIKFHRQEGKFLMKGYNTDAIGFENAIRPFLKSHHTHALILGTGGASKAVDYTLRKLGISTTFVSRKSSPGILSYHDLNQQHMTDNQLIVNCTPLGMSPNTAYCPDIPYELLSPEHLLYDVIYKPDETLFMKKGKERGAVTVNGLEMLYGQAAAAWEIWNRTM